MIRPVRLASVAVLLASLLAACGQAPVASVKATGTTVTRSYDYNAEPVPSEAQLAALEATSPDALIEDAPLEPGLSASAFGVDGIGPKPPNEDLGNFGRVESTLWRGARPTTKGLEKLQAMGVKTIVNFENDKKVVASEKAWAEAHGIRFVSIPLSVITPPKVKYVDQFLALATDASMRPLYFHCMQGRDRTGTAAFCYRVKHDGWSYDKAYAEMTSYHFHSYLLGLKGFLIWFAKTQGGAASAYAS